MTLSRCASVAKISRRTAFRHRRTGERRGTQSEVRRIGCGSCPLTPSSLSPRPRNILLRLHPTAGQPTVPRSIMQHDIFQHSRAVMLRNELARALQRRDAQAAESAWKALATEYPQDAALADASTLRDSLSYFDAAPFAPAQVQQAREAVEKQIAPAAKRQFGDAAADPWLSALWASLARTGGGVAVLPR